MRRVLLAAVATVSCVAVAIGASVGWVTWAAPRGAEARRATLEADLDRLRAADATDAAALCAVYEHARLSAGELRVECAKATVASVGPGVVRLDGAVHTRQAGQYFLGGGHRTPVCLTRDADGWRYAGDAFDLHDCAITPGEGASDVVARDAARARALVETLRAALAAPAAVPERCDAIAPVPTEPVPVVDRALLEGRSPDAGLSSFLVGCLTGELYPGQCALRDTPPWVLVVDEAARIDPGMPGDGTYTPGAVRGQVLLVDTAAAAVRCGGPYGAVLDDPLLFGDEVRITWHRRRAQGVRAAVEALTGGVLGVGPSFD